MPTAPPPSAPSATALAPPLWATAGFSFESPSEAARRAARPRVADFYTRYGNPTVQAFADAVAELEGAEAALCSASGMGAVSTVVLGLCSAGDHIVTQRQLFSATKQLFESVCPRFGIEVSFVDAADTAAWREAIEPGRTTLVFAESPANPTLELVDLAALGSIPGVVTAVDSTLATPLSQRPLDAGIDLVIHSATKALSGHNDATLGVIAGEKSLVNELWQYGVIHGAAASPHDSLNASRGLKTLPLRFARQAQTALAVAVTLSEHRRVDRVYHPCLPGGGQQELACRQLRAGCGLVAFEVTGGLDPALAFLDRLTIPLLAPSLGGPETLVNHPASMTHASLSPDQRAAAGVTDGLIRLSAGLEETAAVVADVDRALS
ncbi:MAG: aminotransferase class I/II-fold pyridoxal phosphate-dependent enzyme [Acidimicrobiia bacterium]|nr:aminotransferase class I/II-fold pyridoxal phosphate-dependent enzyme [Acidimicrobiia bacterium]